MRGRELEKLYRRYLLADLPGFGYKGPLLFAQPVVHLLRGFYFESSAFDADAFYLWVFVQPLYVPVDFIYFDFGTRLSGHRGQGWTMNRQDEGATMADVLAGMKDQGLPFLARVQTPRDLAHKAPLVGGRERSPNSVEAVAYSHLLAQECSEAREAIDRLQAMLRAGDAADPWGAQMLERSELVRDRLERDPRHAVELLEEWNEQTRTNLRLPPD